MMNRKGYWIDLIIKVIMLALLLMLVVQVRAQQQENRVQTTNPALFFLYTKNAVTAYELNFDAQEKLNKVNPLKVSMQKLLGVSVKNQIRCRYIGDDGYEISLAAYQKMPFYLLKSTTDDAYRLYVKDGTSRFLLKSISVKINQGSFKQPRYQYIDLVTTAQF